MLDLLVDLISAVICSPNLSGLGLSSYIYTV